MKKLALIPARLDSSRLPNKLLLPLGEYPVIFQTYKRVKESDLFDKVLVVTNSTEIHTALLDLDADSLFIDKEFNTGTDRIADAVTHHLDTHYDVIINVQGDEPFIDMKNIERIIHTFEQDVNKRIDLISLKHKLHHAQDILNPNNVKVITDLEDNAIYFSRSVIPYQPKPTEAFKHIGVYAFRHRALIDFSSQEQTPLEKLEKIEAIRFIEMGKQMHMLEVEQLGIQIDTAEDYQKAQELIKTL